MFCCTSNQTNHYCMWFAKVINQKSVLLLKRQYFIIHFITFLSEQCRRCPRQNKKMLWKADNRIRECFQRIGKAVDSDQDGSNSSRIRLLINHLLILLLDLLDAEEVELNEQLTDSSRSVKLFLKELDKNLTESWTIEQMAQSAGVGLTRFTHHCKRITNLTPMRYLMIKRLELSKKILVSHEDLSVAEVAFSCGFSTSQYFSTVFKKHEKCTPIEYRNRVLQLVD